MPGKRRRCHKCKQLVSVLWDWCPRGNGFPPRYPLCDTCYDIMTKDKPGEQLRLFR